MLKKIDSNDLKNHTLGKFCMKRRNVKQQINITEINIAEATTLSVCTLQKSNSNVSLHFYTEVQTESTCFHKHFTRQKER